MHRRLGVLDIHLDGLLGHEGIENRDLQLLDASNHVFLEVLDDADQELVNVHFGLGSRRQISDAAAGGGGIIFDPTFAAVRSCGRRNGNLRF